jgi:hypothetical protein
MSWKTAIGRTLNVWVLGIIAVPLAPKQAKSAPNKYYTAPHFCATVGDALVQDFAGS